MFESIVDAVSGSNWSYLIVFVIAMLDAFFPVVPSEATAIAAGVVAGTGGLRVELVILAAALGAIAGDNICFTGGHFLGERLNQRFFQGEKGKKRVLWAQKMLEERGGYIIVVARFIPGGRTVTTFTAGFVDGMPWRRFIRYDTIAGAIWGTYTVMLGYIGGKSFEEEPWKGLILAFAFALAVTVVVEVVRHFPSSPPLERMKLHITGATGYLGSELVRHAPAASTERVEVRDAAAVGELLRRLRPEVVIHTAYLQDGSGAHEVTVEGAENVARESAAVGARLVHLSTDVVFDGRKGAPYVEDDPPSPVTDYGRWKAEAEARVARAHPEAVIVRTSLIYGGAEPSKHERAVEDPGFTFYTNEIRNPVQVGDLAEALLELAELEVSGPLHVAGADAVSRAAFAELITGRPVSRATAPATRPLDCSLDSSRVRGLIRTRLRGVREVLARPA